MFGCSSSIPQHDGNIQKASSIYEGDLRINSKNVYAWINRLPGSKKNRFNVTGDIVIFGKSTYDFRSIKIDKIFVYQNNNLLFQFIPQMKSSIEQDSKTIIFTTVRGLLLTPILDKNKNVQLKINLSDDNNSFQYLIKDVKIEEAF